MVTTQELRIPAHCFRQGGRDVYACVLDLPALNAQTPGPRRRQGRQGCQSAAYPVPRQTDPDLSGGSGRLGA